MDSKNPEYIAGVFYLDTLIESHVFTLEVDGKSRYRAITSINWFNERPRNSNFHTTHIERKALFDRMESHARTRHEERQKKLGSDEQPEPYEGTYDGLPQFKHSTVWDFYKAIGYDYKRQRWVRPAPSPVKDEPKEFDW